MQRIYWGLRKILKNRIFRVKIFLFGVRNYLYDKKGECGFYLIILKKVVKQIFVNILIIWIAFGIEKLFSSIVNNRLEINNQLFSDLLIAMVGVSGIFLGLYCSNMMSIFSTRYANAPKQLASLFENDLLTNRSINSITNYLVFSILILIINLCGIQPGIVLVIICGIKGIDIVVSYGMIGRRTFQLADTYHVIDYVYREIYKNLKIINRVRLFSKDINFQNHCKERTEKLLEVLDEVNDYNIQSPDYRTASMEEFMSSNLYLINNYWKIKPNIVFNSYWYAEKAIYKKWYSASDHEISLAIETNTSIGYRMEKDYDWLENNLMKLNQKSLNVILESETFNRMYKWLMKIDGICSTAVQTGNLNLYVTYVTGLQDKVFHLITENKKITSTNEEMALVESVLMIYIKIIIEIRKYVENVDVENILSKATEYYKVSDIKFARKYYNYEDIVKLYNGINAEIKLEGERITPDWYIKQIVAKHIYDDILCLHIEMEKIVINYVPQFGEELLEKEKFAGAMIVYSKMSELKSKTQDLLPKLTSLLQRIEAFHIEKTIVWSENPCNSFEDDLEAIIRQMPTKWSKCASAFTLNLWEEYNSFPDLLGECYNYVCEFLIEALENADYSMFSEGYKNLWGLVLLYQEVSRKELIKIKESYRQDAVLAVFSNPIIDYGYISGYAYIFGEIIGDNKWKNIVSQSFEQNVEKMAEDSVNTCERLASIMQIPDILRPGIHNRDIIHTNWKQRIERSINELDCLKWENRQFMQVLFTESRLLKAAIGFKDDYQLLHCEAYEIFAVEVLNKHLPVDKKFVSRGKWEKKLDDEE